MAPRLLVSEGTRQMARDPGGRRMTAKEAEMADAAVTEAAEVSTETEATGEVTQPSEDEGAGGKRAILADLAKERSARKQLQSELEQLRQASMSETEKAIAQAKAEGRESALKEIGDRIVRAEVKAAATGKLADPDDAIHLLDMAGLVQADGTVDSKAVSSAIDALVAAKPYLSAMPGAGSGEGGPRGNSSNNPLNGDPLLRDLKSRLGIR